MIPPKKQTRPVKAACFSAPTLYARRGLYERFQKTITQLGLKHRALPMILAVSGGRDSVCLLHLFRVSGRTVTAAHLNHRLRGAESDGDERFVHRLCEAWRIPLVVARENVAQRARRHHLSIEEAARIARYRFLARVAQRKKAGVVLVAHHQRDQAETVLLKLFRGCHPGQLRGMDLVRPLPRLDWRKSGGRRSRSRIRLVRPLLDAPVAEIELYARQNRLKFREDSSNRDLTNPRNWIRHRLLPLLERRLNRNIVKTLARPAV